MTEFCFAML